MIGDNPELDIGGGAAAGLRTAWTANGRTWPAGLEFHPTVLAPDCATALRAVLTG
jgi:putative hydrolase of the HAD superfamily